jgi:cytochrome P450
MVVSMPKSADEPKPKQIPGIRSPIGMLGFQRRLAKDPYSALAGLRTRFGDVVQVSAGLGQVSVFLFGADANAFILSQHKEFFRHEQAYQSLLPVVGETALILTDGGENARRRQLVQPTVRHHGLDGYLGVAVREADRMIDGLPEVVPIDIGQRLRGGIVRSTIGCLLGPQVSEHADEVADTLQPALDFVNLPPSKRRKIMVVGTAYYNAVKARTLIDQVVVAEIDRRKALPGPERPADDVLATLLSGHEGITISVPEILDQVISLMAAGIDTTSTALAWIMDEILRDVAVWDNAAAEVAREVGSRELALDDLPRLTYLDGIISEGLRLHPPHIALPRYVVRDFEYGGFVVPADSLVYYSPYVTARDPDVWLEPDEFLPQRWDESALGYVQPATYAQVAFGGGSRRCIGLGLALLEIKAFLVQILRRLTIKADYRGPRVPSGAVTVGPAGGIPVRVLNVASNAGR